IIDQGSPHSPHGLIRAAIAGATLLRLDPDALRAPAPLIPDGQSVRFADDRGRGLPAIYDALQTRDIQLIADLNRELQGLFPAFKSLRLRNTDAQQKAIGAVLQDGTEVAASELSEGMLYYLALAALPHLDPTPLVLIEEPENGLHPARIADVMKVLRAVSETTQIIMATHSPLVINELEGHEVSVITRDPKSGTQAVLLKDTPNYEARSKAYANGELWLNYCDGEAEAPLVQGGPRP
ncbi:MAG: ATP-binding protein, partial [Myxococcales bacterium]|nr:ATP-binding protein [Myxococcales bacterium]